MKFWVDVLFYDHSVEMTIRTGSTFFIRWIQLSWPKLSQSVLSCNTRLILILTVSHVPKKLKFSTDSWPVFELNLI